MKIESEIIKKLCDAEDQASAGTKFFGMSYEDGVAAGLRWALDEGEDPLADE